MKTKVTVSALLVMGLCLSLALTAAANPWEMKAHKGHRGHWGKFAKLTPEQAGKLFDLRQKFLVDTVSLRKDMVVKRAELRALWRSENPDQKQILAKLKEIDAVKAKLQKKMVPFRLAVKQILPKRPEHKKHAGLNGNGAGFGKVIAMEPRGSGDVGL
jgi:zinc resistance-associated protein